MSKLDEIRLASNVVVVPFEDRAELAQRLDAAGATDAAEELRNRRGWAESRKPRVLLVLDAWLTAVGRANFSDALMDLRHELDRDVNGG